MTDKKREAEVAAGTSHAVNRFYPMTGNPENHNYADWIDHLRAREEETVSSPGTTPSTT